MDDKLRKEIETMIAAHTLELHSQNVARFTRIEERIIGIDGNGTGREGALQRQDKVLASINADAKATRSLVYGLVHDKTSRAKLLKALAWVAGLGGPALATWLTHHYHL